MSYTLNSKRNHYLYLLIILAFLIKVVFLGRYDLLAEEAYYWNYAIHLDWGYLDHPPMVALLIKFATSIFGVHEFAVRLMGLPCWLVTAYFSYKLSEAICFNTGWYAVLLVSILPYFFVFSLVMTPDLPLMAAWSAALYYLYQALCLQRQQAWYQAGLAVGIGLLSKYSIVLIFLATALHMILVKPARQWFKCKEPYLALILSFLIFTPVIYWNAMHHWASFAFQSTRRLHSEFNFSLHELLGLTILFLTPIGVLGLWKLFAKPSTLTDQPQLPMTTVIFIRIFFLLPISIFGFFSLTHEIKWNWIGPSTLALIPWLAVWMKQRAKLLSYWLLTGFSLCAIYIIMLSCMSFGRPEVLNQILLNKYISWDNFTENFDNLAKKFDNQGHEPIFVPLDSYSIASELMFYQTKAYEQRRLKKIYSVYGASFFGYQSLMFDFWTKASLLNNKTVIIIAKLPEMLHSSYLSEKTYPLSAPHAIWAYSQGKHSRVKKYYYQVVQILPQASGVAPRKAGNVKQ